MTSRNWCELGTCRAAELLRRLEDAQAYVGKLEAERDALRADMIQCVSDGRKMATDLYRAQNERDAARRELEQAQNAARQLQEKLDWLIAHDPEVEP